MNRREFITTGLAAATLPPMTGFGQEAASETADQRIRIGFLGGSHSHGLGKAKVCLESPETWNIIGIVEESDEVRANYEKLGIKALDEEELLATADVIAVESDPRDHYKHGKLVLESNKHLHLEKPPTMTLEEFQELVAIATSKKLIVQMGYMWRYNPGINAALKAAREGWLGKIYLVKAEINKLQSADARVINNSFPGGTMFELGCHVLDPVVRLLGRPNKVDTYLKTSGAFTDGIKDNTVAVLDYPDATAIIGSSILHSAGGRHRHLHIYGTNGTALVKPLDRPVLELELTKDAGPYKKGLQTVEFPPFRRYVGDFVELAEVIKAKKGLSITPEMDLVVHETLLRACEVGGTKANSGQ